MKERIKNEVTAFLKSFPFGKVPDAYQLAEHFYNLALEDVKKEVEKLAEKAKSGKGEYRNGAQHTLIAINDFVEKQEV